MRRQILEGVVAVMKINRMTLASQKFQLSIFDRSSGVNNVKFEEYAGLDLYICVELVLRARTTHRPPQNDFSTSPYGLPIVTNQQQQSHHPQQIHNQQPANLPFPPHHQSQQQQPHHSMSTPQQHHFSPNTPSFPPHPSSLGSGQPHQPPPQQPHAQPPSQLNISSAINGMDSSSLQQLLGSLQGNPSSSTSAHQQNPATPSLNQHHHHQHQQSMPQSAGVGQPPTQNQMNDLARIFGTQSQMPPQQQSAQFQSLAGNPAFAGLFGGQQPQQQQQQGGGQGQGQGGHQQQQYGGHRGGQPGQGQQQGGQQQGQPDMSNIMAQLARYGGR